MHCLYSMYLISLIQGVTRISRFYIADLFLWECSFSLDDLQINYTSTVYAFTKLVDNFSLNKTSTLRLVKFILEINLMQFILIKSRFLNAALIILVARDAQSSPVMLTQNYLIVFLTASYLPCGLQVLRLEANIFSLPINPQLF